jgi:hypothetical protein
MLTGKQRNLVYINALLVSASVEDQSVSKYTVKQLALETPSLPFPTQALPKINGTPFATCVSAPQAARQRICRQRK